MPRGRPKKRRSVPIDGVPKTPPLPRTREEVSDALEYWNLVGLDRLKEAWNEGDFKTAKSHLDAMKTLRSQMEAFLSQDLWNSQS